MLDQLHAILKPAIERSRGRESFASILQEIDEGRSVLWTGFKGNKLMVAATGQVITYPHARVLRIPFLAGEGMTDILQNEQEVLDFAVKQGCSSMELIGRPGWEKVLTKVGWEKSHIVMEKRINEWADDARDAADGADGGSDERPARGSDGRDATAPGDATTG